MGHDAMTGCCWQEAVVSCNLETYLQTMYTWEIAKSDHDSRLHIATIYSIAAERVQGPQAHRTNSGFTPLQCRTVLPDWASNLVLWLQCQLFSIDPASRWPAYKNRELQWLDLSSSCCLKILQQQCKHPWQKTFVV